MTLNQKGELRSVLRAAFGFLITTAALGSSAVQAVQIAAHRRSAIPEEIPCSRETRGLYEFLDEFTPVNGSTRNIAIAMNTVKILDERDRLLPGRRALPGEENSGAAAI